MTKKKLIGLGFIFLGILVLIGCASLSTEEFDAIQESSTPTIFEGTWIHPNPESRNFAIVFLGNSFSNTWDEGNSHGRFTYENNHITFFTYDGRKWSTTYNINDGQIRFEQGSGNLRYYWYGNFWLLDLNQNMRINGTWRHPNPLAQGATFTFTDGQFIYSREDGVNESGEYNLNAGRLTLIVSGEVVKEYVCYRALDGSQIELANISGDGTKFFQGLFNKQ